jgi:hypothetical protein
MIDFSVLEAAWRSSGNTPSAAASAYLTEELVSTLKRRRAALDRMLAFAGVVLTIFVGRVLIDVLTGRANPAELLREWAVLPLLAVPLVVLLILMRARRSRVRTPDGTMPLAETFRTALADNAAARMTLRIILASQIVAMPLLVVALFQLGASGKMAPHEQMSAGVVLGGALLSGIAFVVVRYVTQLLPERRQLESLIEQYKA